MYFYKGYVLYIIGRKYTLNKYMNKVNIERSKILLLRNKIWNLLSKHELKNDILEISRNSWVLESNSALQA